MLSISDKLWLIGTACVIISYTTEASYKLRSFVAFLSALLFFILSSVYK